MLQRCGPASILPLIVLCAAPAPAARGQTEPSRSASFAVSSTDEEHDHFVERFIPRSTGIYVEPVYYGELFTSTRGGISTDGATRYAGLFDLTLVLDFDRMGVPIPGKFVILGQNVQGRGLTLDFVGDSQVLSNIDAFGDRTQVGEYWWDIPLCDGSITVRLGKQDLNGDFLVVERAQDFIQSSFGISPALALPTYPDNSLAAVALMDLSEALTLRLGIWDGVPDGRSWGYSGTGITFTVGEIQYSYELAGLSGAIQTGIGYRSAGTEEGEAVSQTWAYYVDWEQSVWRENRDDEDDDQGLGAFVQYGVGYPQAIVAFPGYVGAGVLYHGLLPQRDGDTIGLGVAQATLNSGGTGRETAVELFYKIQLRPHLYLQPDAQYIASPSGIYRDALVVGMRVEAAF